jgi:hypothetical protein
MSIDLDVYTPAVADFPYALLAQNMRVLGWELRVVDAHDTIVTTMPSCGSVIAWDPAYQPAPAYQARYVPGAVVDFTAVPEDELLYLGSCAFTSAACRLDAMTLDDDGWDIAVLRRCIGEEAYARFAGHLQDGVMRKITVTSYASANLYRALLQVDLASLIAWMTDGFMYDPQENECHVFTALKKPEQSPLQQARALMAHR